MAAESGLDLRSIQGSGPGGRIIKKDIEAALSQPKAAPAPQPRYPRPVEPGQPVPVGAPSAYRDEPATQIRQTIAKRLVTSLGPVPHFFLTTEIEMDRAAEMRKGINALDPDLKISINDIIIKVTAAALMQHPEVNASFQETLCSLLRTRRHWRGGRDRRRFDYTRRALCRSEIVEPDRRAKCASLPNARARRN